MEIDVNYVNYAIAKVWYQCPHVTGHSELCVNDQLEGLEASQPFLFARIQTAEYNEAAATKIIVTEATQKITRTG